MYVELCVCECIINKYIFQIEGSGWGILNVCTSRIRAINTNSTDDVSCTSVNTNTHIIEVSCGNAEFIHRCEPLYISVMVNSSITNFQCKGIVYKKYKIIHINVNMKREKFFIVAARVFVLFCLIYYSF